MYLGRTCSFIYSRGLSHSFAHLTACVDNLDEAATIGKKCLVAAACALPKRLCWLDLSRQISHPMHTTASILFLTLLFDLTIGHQHVSAFRLKPLFQRYAPLAEIYITRPAFRSAKSRSKPRLLSHGIGQLLPRCFIRHSSIGSIKSSLDSDSRSDVQKPTCRGIGALVQSPIQYPGPP